MNEYHPPSINEHSFNCPHCNVFAHQHWHQVWCAYNFFGQVPGQSIDMSAETRPVLVSAKESQTARYQAAGMFIGRCQHCDQITVWLGKAMIYPDRGAAPPPNEDLSEDIRKDYEEAASICSKSPRGAAALLRLAMQKICGELGKSKKNLNDAIGELVQDGLHPKIQKSMDYVRVTGNDAVHPGQIDVRDNPEIAGKLFDLVNGVAQEMITREKMVDELYESLPAGKKDQIDQRDKK